MPTSVPSFRVYLLALAAFLAAGCRQEPPRPRELPFPTFESAAPFPELSVPAAQADASGSGDFERLLKAEGAEAEPSAEPALQSVALGGPLVGRIPIGDAWQWSTAEGVTLILYAPAAGRPATLIYAESFSPLIQRRPSKEHHRFQVAVDPDRSEGYLEPESAWDLASGGPHREMAERADLSRTEAGHFVQLLGTRTAGRGLGFRPTAGTFTGWRWVGRNPHGVALRVGRQSGTWADPKPLPARFQKALERLATGTGGSHLPAAGASAPGAQALEIPAYLVLGSAAERQEESGVHLALLCVRTPDCPVAGDLAAFLDSLQIGDPGLVERLLAAPMPALEDLARTAGIEIRPASAGETTRR
ncbi:MAG TPA: hypothetical protein VE685_06885 [Thermoanaerobaculia bacterium]|nr:hypothetical protein [Thermoanaerobaculia bacterium]